MRKINTLVVLMVCILIPIFLLVSSCDKMNDIQKKYADREEIVYLGKVDSVETFSGFGAVKLTWYMNADPKIDRTIIYWNLRQDSIVKEFERTDAGVVKDSIIIDNLPEGTIRFEFRNVNDEGETSLYSSASAIVWGPEFADGLFARKLTGFDYNYTQSSYKLNLSPTHTGDSVIYSQILYTNTQGKEMNVRIERDSNNIELDNFPDGGELRFRTVFFLPQGIDTVFNDYEIFKAPTAVFDQGKKLSYIGKMTSKYFGREDSLYEWNADGDVIIYAINVNGQVTQADVIPSIMSRSNFRDFFFYDADKFIAISNDNGVYMYRLENGELSGVGAGKFGSGFAFPTFIPGRGFFFSVTDGTGDLRVWFAKDDATWDSPNGTTSGTGFTQYNPLTMFNRETLLGVDSAGYLWSFPVRVNGDLGPKKRIGSGWNRFKKIISVGTNLLGMEENGNFYLFENFNTSDKFYVENE